MMRSTKRIILADGSRLVREMLHRALDKADRLEVVQELHEYGDLPSAIRRFDPAWVILSFSYNEKTHGWLDACMEDHPCVRFIFLSPSQNHIKMMWQTSYEEEYANLSLNEFIDILERDVQPT